MERVSWLSDDDDRAKAMAMLDWPIDADADLESQDHQVRSAIAALGIEFDEDMFAAAWAERQAALAQADGDPSSADPDASAIMGGHDDTI